MLLFILILACGILVNIPYLNFQLFLAQGDHGRDLYAAQSVLRGDIPYKDFWWVYGPLMPYYYALFFKFFGIKITSILLGKALLNIVAGLFVFLGSSLIMPIFAAFTCALWFLIFHNDFFFTYNHAGGIALLLAAVWMQLGYLKTGRIGFAWGGLLTIFILGLIKINFALTSLVMMLIVLTLKDFLDKAVFDAKKKGVVITALVLIPCAWFLIYAHFLHGLSITEIRQCLPYLGGDEPYNNFGPLETLPILLNQIKTNITAGPVDWALCALIVSSSFLTFTLLLKRKLEPLEHRLTLLMLGFGGLFYVLNLHEFLKSGVFYRAFWSQPFSILLTFIVIATATQKLPTWLQNTLWILLIVIASLTAYNKAQIIQQLKNPQHFFGGTRGGIYLSNDPVWMQTVVLTTKQLNATFKNKESFFALPYDCLYYYLTNTKSPTRQLIFFDHIKITSEQEQSILVELERQHIAGVLVSSRQSSHERGLGTLGESYCPMITQYINANFVPTAKIGDWVNAPGWAWNHGTLILKRKEAPGTP